MNFNPYLLMDGNAEQAILKYAQAFGAEYQIMNFKEAPPNPEFKIPESMMDLVMHGEVRLKNLTIMVCDATPMMPIVKANNVQVALTLLKNDELDLIYKILSDSGHVIMEPQETFFAKKYASFTDMFGVTWQLIADEQ